MQKFLEQSASVFILIGALGGLGSAFLGYNAGVDPAGYGTGWSPVPLTWIYWVSAVWLVFTSFWLATISRAVAALLKAQNIEE